MAKYHDGDVWAKVRGGLSLYRERLSAARAATTYERESAILDDVAREIAADVCPMIASYSEKRST